jgi:hypothetical protein
LSTAGRTSRLLERPCTSERDVGKDHSVADFAAKLRRLADAFGIEPEDGDEV